MSLLHAPRTVWAAPGLVERPLPRLRRNAAPIYALSNTGVCAIATTMTMMMTTTVMTMMWTMMWTMMMNDMTLSFRGALHIGTGHAQALPWHLFRRRTAL